LDKSQSIKTNARIAVIGAGPDGLAMAGHLAIMGHTVNLYDVSGERLWFVKASHGISVQGVISGFGNIELATNSLDDAIQGTDIIMVMLPENEQWRIAMEMAKYIREGNLIVLHACTSQGFLELSQILVRNNAKAGVTITGTNEVVYSSFITGPGKVNISAIRDSVSLITTDESLSPESLSKLRMLLPQITGI
jgi:opine dehydrogenase